MTLTFVSMTIGGRAVDDGPRSEVLNPATEKPWAEIVECSREQLDAAFDAAKAAGPGWAADEGARRKGLDAIAATLRDNVDELADLLSQEQGKAVPDAKLEIQGAAVWYDYYATLEVDMRGSAGSYPAPSGEVQATTIRRPLGVIAAITPWNFPIALAAWKLGPALLAGNTIVLKPSPYTPVSTLRLGELLRDVLPAGVVNVVSGGDDLGAWMTTHPLTAKISFTGSVSTGKAVARAAADDLKRVTLELGGNDPAVLLDDVDIKAIALPLFWAAMYNNGQICGAVKRIYVHESQVEALAAEFVTIAEAVVVGDGAEPGTVQGPINNRAQFDRVNELLAEAVADGGKIRTGGSRTGDAGYFLRPTVLTDVPETSRLVTEEQFGPVIPLISYSNVDDVVAATNASTFGLGSSVWGADADRARAVAERLDVGMTWVNMHGVTGPGVPFGGAKWSGIGVEGGPDGVYSFTQLQVIHQG